MAKQSATVPAVVEMLKDDHKKVKGLFDCRSSFLVCS